MLIIDCPHCGPRMETEFHYGGQADVAYPADAANLPDADWAQFLFYRDNPRGDFAERWVHTAGCRKWLTVTRNTVTNEFTSTPRAGAIAPEASTDAHVTTTAEAPLASGADTARKEGQP